MLSDEEKDNVFKISVQIITNEELERLDYTLENNLDNIVQQISETVSRDKDIIILKKVIEKQSKEIEELKITNKELTERVLRLESDKFWNNVVSKDKIKAKIEEIKEEVKTCSIYKKTGLCTNNCKEDCEYYDFIDILQSLLEKEE